MDDKETRERAAVILEAKTWLRTPYHHQGRVKGAGVDCAMLPAAVYSACRLIPAVDPGYYPADWHLHSGREIYLEWVLKFAVEIPGPGLPGDFVLFKFGRCWAHGGIVIKWPHIIHAFLNCPVSQDDANREHRLLYMGEAKNKPRPRRFFTLWPDPALKSFEPLNRQDNGRDGAF